MRLRDMDVYRVAFLFFNLDMLFEKDKEIQKANEWLMGRSTDAVLNPKLSKEGFRNRQFHIMGVCGVLLIISIIIFFFTLFILQGLFGVNMYTKVFFVIPQYLIGTGIHIALFRGLRASLDERRFMRAGQPEDFVPSTRVPIRWYDFIAAIPFGLLALLW